MTSGLIAVHSFERFGGIYMSVVSLRLPRSLPNSIPSTHFLLARLEPRVSITPAPHVARPPSAQAFPERACALSRRHSFDPPRLVHLPIDKRFGSRTPLKPDSFRTQSSRRMKTAGSLTQRDGNHGSAIIHALVLFLDHPAFVRRHRIAIAFTPDRRACCARCTTHTPPPDRLHSSHWSH